MSFVFFDNSDGPRMVTPVAEFASVDVSVADRLYSDSSPGWTFINELTCEQLSVGVAPSIDSARLTYRYGTYSRRFNGQPAGYVPPANLIGQYVRIRAYDGGGNLQLWWAGVIESQSDSPDGGGGGDEIYTAYGIPFELKRTTIRTSMVRLDLEGRGNDFARVYRQMGFNIHPAGSKNAERGNRSANANQGGGTTHIFAREPTETPGGVSGERLTL